MYKKYSIPQMIELKKQGWVSPHRVTDWKSELQKEAGAQGFTYKAPNFDPSKHLISPENGDTYIAGMQNLPNSQLEQLHADPELQQLAASMGVRVDDLLLYREMILDRYANRYQDPE
jgi:hypothetical protein